MGLLRRNRAPVTGRWRSSYTPFVAVLAAMALAPVEGAVAQDRPGGPRSHNTVEDSRLLWATVNVCDTGDHPDTIGIRGSMPGAKDGSEIMYMRFRAQYFSSVDGRWHGVRSGGDSGFVRVGLARYEARQAGRSFRFAPKTDAVLLRGVVTFEWRKKGEVVRRARERTVGGHRTSAGADPKDHTAPNCKITA